MDGKLLQQLTEWRDKEARRRGVPEYRVLQTGTLEEIASKKPTTKEELLAVKGIAEKKWATYGTELLRMISGESTHRESGGDKDTEPVSVSEYLTRVNRALAELHARVRGEVTQIREKYGNYYFTMSDPDDESAIDCYMRGRDYDMAGIEVQEGMEVVVEGFSSVYKKYGRFSFRAASIELVGEGALKKAYEKLKKKLTEEGLFSDERKQEVPPFVQKVGLVTSRGSDAFHDVAANLGTYGFSIRFFPSRVQGGRAVKELLAALSYFKNADVDVVIITRGGGGDLEVLQAFNNERVVRAVSEMDVPVIAGIGHEKDIPLTSLVADVMVSTPTGAAEILNRSWRQLEKTLDRFAQRIPARFHDALRHQEHQLDRLAGRIETYFSALFGRVDQFEQQILRAFDRIEHLFARRREAVGRLAGQILDRYASDLKEVRTAFRNLSARLGDADPRKALRLGFSIVRSERGVVRSISDVSTDDVVDIRVSDGTIESRVTDTRKQDTEDE